MRGKRGKNGGRTERRLAAAALLAGLGLVAVGLYRPAAPVRPGIVRPPAEPGPVAPQAAIRPVAPAEPPPAAAPPVSPPGELPAWRRNAVAAGPEDGRPMIAIVLDDMGLDRARSAAALTLPAPLTLSFMAYAADLPAQTEAARAHGHELMLHVPMEPQAARIDPGPNALTVTLDDTELRRRLGWDLDRLDGIVGANNHMGSRFTEWPHGMEIVEEMLRERGLFVLDSRTTPHTVVVDVAKSIGLPWAKRDVFLDDDMAAPAVGRELARTEEIARRNGFAVAIGHPHDATIAELRGWLPTLAARGFRLVPVSAIVLHNEAATVQETAD
jgi:polysaccharide deacetylase 2 family uncharacterized protein YibQ